MKYYTLEYNMNCPYSKQIQMPLLSKQGVAMKVFKDGQQISLKPGDVDVEGAANWKEYAGWLTFELSSGDAPSLEEKKVDVSSSSTAKAAGTYVTMTVPDTMVPVEGIFEISSLEGLSLPVSLKAEDVDYSVKFSLSSASGIVSSDVELDVNLLQLGSSTGAIIAYQYLKEGESGKEARTWYKANVPVDEVEISAGCYLTGGSNLIFTQDNTVAIVSASVDIDTKDGANATFPLYVQAADAGWFEADLSQDKTEVK